MSQTLSLNSSRLVGLFRFSRTNPAKGSVRKGLAVGVAQSLDSVLFGSVHRGTEGGGGRTQFESVQPRALTNTVHFYDFEKEVNLTKWCDDSVSAFTY